MLPKQASIYFDESCTSLADPVTNSKINLPCTWQNLTMQIDIFTVCGKGPNLVVKKKATATVQHLNSGASAHHMLLQTRARQLAALPSNERRCGMCTTPATRVSIQPANVGLNHCHLFQPACLPTPRCLRQTQ